MKTNKIFLGSVLFLAATLIPGLIQAGTSGCLDTSLGVSYLYIGNDDYVTYNDCPPPISYDSSTHYFIPKTGFKITNPSPDYDGKVYAFNPSGMTIQWTGDGLTYPINYEILPNFHAGTADPLECGGGTYVTTDCDPATGYRVKTCPFSEYGYICPGYDPQSIATGGYLDSIGVEFEPYDPKVSVKGLIPGEAQEYEYQINVPYPAHTGQSNVETRWYTQDVTSCSCTYNGTPGDCTPSGDTASLRLGEFVYAQGDGSEGGDGAYSLTEDKTFRVVCQERE